MKGVGGVPEGQALIGGRDIHGYGVPILHTHVHLEHVDMRRRQRGCVHQLDLAQTGQDRYPGRHGGQETELVGHRSGH